MRIKNFKLFESNNEMVEKYGDVINKIDNDIQFIRDKILELQDMDYFAYVDYTPMTYTLSIDKPEFFLDIQNKNNEDFYGNLGEKREEVNMIILDILHYMEESDYLILYKENRVSEIREDKPTNFKFINNPTNYQILFTTK